MRTFLALIICLIPVVLKGQADLNRKSSNPIPDPIHWQESFLDDAFMSSSGDLSDQADVRIHEGPVVVSEDGIACRTLIYYENDGVVVLDDNLDWSGVSGNQMTSATVHIYENYKPNQDSLVFEDQNGISGIFDRSEGVFVLTGAASLDNYKKALASVGYINTSEDPDNALRKVNFYVNNGTDNLNFERTYIEVVPVNDPPVITGSQTVLPYYPGTGAVVIDTKISITDVDDSIMWQGRVWMPTTYKPSEDLLDAAAQFGLNVFFDETTAYLRILGPATIEQYEIILAAATYTNTNPDPEPSVRSVYFKVFDYHVRSNFHIREIEIQPRNLPPQIVDINDIPRDTLYIEAIKDIDNEIIVKAIDPDNDTTKVTEVISYTDNSLVDNDDIDDMTFVYTPDPGFIGSDTLKVVVCDTGIPSLCDSAIVVVQVEPDPDAAPEVRNTEGDPADTLFYETEEDIPLDFCLIVVNPGEGNALISSISESNSGTGHGGLVESDEGPYCLTYTPDENFNGRSIWNIGLCNDLDPPDCGNLIVVIDVLPVNDEPVALNDTITASRNYTHTGNVLDNDYDIDGDNLIVNTMPETSPLHGSLDLHSDGSFEYTPDTGYTGEDGFTYVVCDDGDPSLCASADVIIYVEDVALKVYNAVSPNGDELNDFLYIEGIEYYPDNLLSIYDRYNNLVYETLGYNNNSVIWEGQANKGLITNELPGETYFYILNPGDGTPLLKGFIMLKKD